MRALLRNVGLPRNSKIGIGKIWPAPEGARRAKAFEIYRLRLCRELIGVD